ncbi:hypothetical protein PRUPE_4G198400 [Prunus persica]|uniref:Ribulose bisphosphate carboxylase small subunit n=1 Tax=Prunus persica TaxID=3760 RepID=A0A251PN72_PRUPE|nr:hypothetical protein PRUPE_4G198400 [Prunus persica]
MRVWPPIGLKKFETLSYLPPLSAESLAKEVDYLLRNNWVPTLEFELGAQLSPNFYARTYPSLRSDSPPTLSQIIQQREDTH